MSKNKNTSYAEEGLEAVNADAAAAEAAIAPAQADAAAEDNGELQQVNGLEPIAFYYRTSAPKKPTKAPFKILEKGSTIEGVYEKAFVSGKFKNPTYIIRNTEGVRVGISGAGSLRRAMDKLAEGSKVKITYGGMSTIKNGEWAGSDAHNFLVFGSKFKA